MQPLNKKVTQPLHNKVENQFFFILQKKIRNLSTKNEQTFFKTFFLAALSSSRRLVVRPSVRRSVREVCEKKTFRVSNGNINLPKTYLPTYLCDRGDSSDSCDNSDSSDSSESFDSSDSSDSSDTNSLIIINFCP